MAESDGGGLFFSADLDNEKLNAAVDETLRRIQGLSEGTASTGREIDEAFDSAAAKIRKSLADIGEACATHEAELQRMEAEYQRLGQEASRAFVLGRDDESNALKKQQEGIQGQITARQALIKELREQSDVLEKAAQKEEENSRKAEENANAHMSLRGRIRELREDMALMIDRGINEQSEAYKKLSEELGRLVDIQGDIAQQGKVLSNDEAQFEGIVTGLSGLAGGFSAVTGAVSLFSGENENLQKVMAKVQSVMAITIGMQQVAQVLNKDSAFQLVTLNKLKQWWRNITVQATAATVAETTATRAATAANVGLAGAFRMVGAAIKSIPVFGWILAGVSGLIALIVTLNSKTRAARKEQEAFGKVLSESLYEPLGTLESLSVKWSQLGNTLAEKKRFVEDNKEAFDKLGVSVRDVKDAENLLTANKDKFIEAQMAKAKALVFTQQAAEKVKKLIQAEQELSQMSDTIRVGGSKIEIKNPEKEEKQKEVDQLRADTRKIYENAANAERDGLNILKEAGINGIKGYNEGTVGALEQAIAREQEALKSISDPSAYKAKIAQIEELKKKLEAITGKTGDKVKDPFLDMLDKRKEEYARYYAWVNSGDEFLVRSAEEEFAGLLKDGTNFIAFLKQERAKLLGDNADTAGTEEIGALTVENRKKLETLNNKIARETNQSVVEEFSKDLDMQIDKAHSALEMLKVIEDKRKELSGDDSELDNQKKDVLDKAETTATAKLKEDTASLLEEYASYIDKKRKLDEEYFNDLAVLAAAYAKADNEEDRAEIDKVITARKKKYNKDSKGGGDEEYARMLEDYATFEQKKQAIIDSYDEKRRIAAEHNNQEMLEQLNEEQQRTLSKLGLDELVKNPDWSKMFGDLDEVTTRELNKFLQQIENLDPTVLGVEFSPEDLQKIQEVIAKMKAEIQERNPFAGLIQGVKDYRKAGDDAAKKTALKDSLTSTKEILELVSGTIKAVTGSLETLGVTMDEETQTVVNDITGILDGGAKLAEGIATGNPLAIIEGSIGVISNGIDLIFGAHDRKANASIRRHAEAVEALKSSYEDLERAIDKAIGEGVYKAQAAAILNLQRQQKEIEAMLAAEKSKKKPDSNKIKEYEKQIGVIGNTVEDLLEDTVNTALDGLNAKGIASQLSDAFFEAFENGKNAAEGWGDSVNNIVKQIAKNLLVQKLLEEPIQKLIESLTANAYDTVDVMEAKTRTVKKTVTQKENLTGGMGRVVGTKDVKKTVYEQETYYEKVGEEKVLNIDKVAEALPAFGEGMKGLLSSLEEGLQKYPELQDLFGGGSGNGTDTSLTGAVKGITEESASIIAGQLNASRMNQVEANQIHREATQMLRQQLFHLANIDRNTEAIEGNTRYIKDIQEGVGKIVTAGGGQNGTKSSQEM